MPKKTIFLGLITCLALFATTVQALPLKRTILVLYDSYEDSEERDGFRYNRYAAMVLNHLGMKPRYYDIDQGLPPEDKMEDVYGILTWFRDDVMFGAQDYLNWLKKQIDKGIKVVIMEQIGAEVELFREKDPKTKEWKEKPIPLSELNQVFNMVGLEFKANFMKKTFLLELTHIDSNMMNFERDIKFYLKSYIHMTSLNPQNKSYFKAKLRGREDSESDLVITTPKGAYVAPGAAIFDATTDLKQNGWLLNPFKFFSEAFSLGERPKPDYTTLYGNRILYAHIDGDGFNNISYIDRKTFSAEIIYEKILKKYKIPHSVSVVVAEIDPKLLGKPQSIPLAKKILELPHIEVGSHGYAHPFDWKEKNVKLKNDFNVIPAMYTHGYKEINYQKEIEFSTQWINETLLSSPKKVKTFHWTGSCNPPPEALKIPYEMGLLNINGGDSQFDTNWPTLFGVAPLTRQSGSYIQFLSSNANENIYTNLWKGPFYGYKRVIETFKNTDQPRRLSPMDIYYHYYSGEQLSALKSLEMVYDYTLSQPHIAVFPSQYLGVARGFLETSIEKIKDGWLISNNKDLRTMRFDEAENKYPDFEKSKGIIGFIHHNQSLYVHLDDSATHSIFLTDKKPTSAYLKSSNVLIKNWKKIKETKGWKLNFEVQGIVPALIYIAGLNPSQNFAYTIGKLKLSKNANKEGILSLEFPLEGSSKLSISL